MKKTMMLALVSLMFVGGMTKAFAQEDSAQIAEAPKDTISIDTMDPKFYEEEEAEEPSSNAATYAIIGGIIVLGGAAYYFMSKKKK